MNLYTLFGLFVAVFVGVPLISYVNNLDNPEYSSYTPLSKPSDSPISWNISFNYSCNDYFTLLFNDRSFNNYLKEFGGFVQYHYSCNNSIISMYLVSDKFINVTVKEA